MPLSEPRWTCDGVFGFANEGTNAAALAAALGVPYETVEVHTFPDAECKVRVTGRTRRPMLYRSLNNPNAKLIEIILAASALRDGGAEDIALAAPYLAYMRQDIAFQTGEAVSQKVIGRLLAQHFDRFLSVDPHLHRTPTLAEVFGGKPALALRGAVAVIAHLKARAITADALIVGPDIESEPLARGVAEPLGLDWAVARKERSGDRDVQITLAPGLAARRPVIIVDDVISSGATMAALARLLKAAGALSVEAYTTHALFDGAAHNAMIAAGIGRIYSCDGVTHATNAISLTPIIVEGLKQWL